MKTIRYATVMAAIGSVALVATPAQAFFHLWTFSEFYTSSDGNVQFIEIVASGSFETASSGAQIRTTSESHTFNFPSSLTNPTSRLLIATSGFGSLTGGVAPDLVLPVTKFFDPAGDTIKLFHPSLGEFQTKTLASFPTDGVTSINYPPIAGSPLTNSPRNRAGQTGSVNVPPPLTTTGDYNGDLTVDAADYTTWRDTLGAEVDEGSGADGDGDGTIDDGDYDYWKSKFGDVIGGSGSATAAIVVPEPTVVSLSLGGVIAGILAALRNRRAMPRFL